MFNWTVINDVPRGIANSTGAVGAESIVMSPVMTETTLVLCLAQVGSSIDSKASWWRAKRFLRSPTLRDCTT